MGRGFVDTIADVASTAAALARENTPMAPPQAKRRSKHNPGNPSLGFSRLQKLTRLMSRIVACFFICRCWSFVTFIIQCPAGSS